MATPKLYIELKNNTEFKPLNEVQTFDFDRDGGKRTKIKDGISISIKSVKQYPPSHPASHVR